MSLANRGCYGGFLGEDARILSIKENSFADIIGMNNSLVNQASIGTGALKINTTNDSVISILINMLLEEKVTLFIQPYK